MRLLRSGGKLNVNISQGARFTSTHQTGNPYFVAIESRRRLVSSKFISKGMRHMLVCDRLRVLDLFFE